MGKVFLLHNATKNHMYVESRDEESTKVVLRQVIFGESQIRTFLMQQREKFQSPSRGQFFYES